MAVLQVGVVVVCYAVGPAILARRLDGLPSLGIMALSLTGRRAAVLPVGIAQWPATTPSREVLAAIVVLAVVCTAAAFLVFAALIGEIGPVRATVITYVNPMVAAVLGVLVLGEVLAPPMLLGLRARDRRLGPGDATSAGTDGAGAGGSPRGGGPGDGRGLGTAAPGSAAGRTTSWSGSPAISRRMFALDRSTTPAMLLRLPPPMCGVTITSGRSANGLTPSVSCSRTSTPGARQVPGHDRLAQRALVHEAAAAAVHEIRAGGHRRQLGRADQVVGLGRRAGRGGSGSSRRRGAPGGPAAARRTARPPPGPAAASGRRCATRTPPPARRRSARSAPSRRSPRSRRRGRRCRAGSRPRARTVRPGSSARWPAAASARASISITACSAAPIRLTPGL